MRHATGAGTQQHGAARLRIRDQSRALRLQCPAALPTCFRANSPPADRGRRFVGVSRGLFPIGVSGCGQQRTYQIICPEAVVVASGRHPRQPALAPPDPRRMSWPVAGKCFLERIAMDHRPSMARTILLAALLPLALAACAPDAWRPESPYDAFIDQVQKKCFDQSIGLKAIGPDLLPFPGWPTAPFLMRRHVSTTERFPRMHTSTGSLGSMARGPTRRESPASSPSCRRAHRTRRNRRTSFRRTRPAAAVSRAGQRRGPPPQAAFFVAPRPERNCQVSS